jgi:hypothetical protein
MAPLFQPISGIISDPVKRAGLGREAGNVFLLPIWKPLNPKLAGLWSEREFAYGLGHSTNMRRFPQDGHLRPRSTSIQIQLRHDPEFEASWKKLGEVPQTGRGRPAACIGETGPDGASPLRPDDTRSADAPLTTRRYQHAERASATWRQPVWLADSFSALSGVVPLYLWRAFALLAV